MPNPRTVRKPLQSIWMCQRQRCRKMRYTLFCFGLNFSKRKTPQFLGITVFLVRQKGFEPPASPLGEPLNICHLCSPMYRKVAIRQAFFVFRVAPCSSKFTGVVRCSPVHFSSFLDFSKKGNKNIFYLPPILAHPLRAVWILPAWR